MSCWVADEIRTWPPCAAAQARAATNDIKADIARAIRVGSPVWRAFVSRASA